MAILTLIIFCIPVALVVVTGLQRLENNSRDLMVHAAWLDETERFKIITRWGAQH